jgi:pimeloyl-ACP methyl ester carboxylesterase
VIAVRSPAREQTRARDPDETGVVVRDGVRVAWERYGDGTPTILLMPTWSIIHSRHWKGQIPYLARHFRVVTFDGRGNGRSDRPTGEDAYSDREFVADACAVLDASRTEHAVVVGLSMGGGYALRLAAEHPERVLAVVFEGAAVHLREPDLSARAGLPSADRPFAQYEGWEKYDFEYWRWDYEDFAEFFFGQCYTEPHSTKQIEDAVGWAREIGPEALILSDLAPYLEGTGSSVSPGRTVALTRALATRVRCPALVIHGSADAIIDMGRGRALAEALGARFIQLDGGGHIPSGRHPVWFNLMIREFVESLPRHGR